MQKGKEINVTEQGILKLIALGYNNKEIGEKLYVSIHTVKVYISIIYEKLGAIGRANAVYIAVVNKIIPKTLRREDTGN